MLEALVTTRRVDVPGTLRRTSGAALSCQLRTGDRARTSYSSTRLSARLPMSILPSHIATMSHAGSMSAKATELLPSSCSEPQAAFHHDAGSGEPVVTRNCARVLPTDRMAVAV